MTKLLMIWLPTLGAIAFTVLFVSLGQWQLGRAVEKESLVQEAQVAAQGGPSALSGTESPQRLRALRFRDVNVEGTYLSDRQWLLDNRTFDGQAGYHVYTPLKLRAQGVVLINRGWLPVGRDRWAMPALPAPEAFVRITGRVRLPREDQLVLGDAGHQGEDWPRVVQRIEIDAMSNALGAGLLPIVIELSSESEGGFAREWGPFIGIGPERHRGYAFQWFALATAVIVVWSLLTGREWIRRWRMKRQQQ